MPTPYLTAQDRRFLTTESGLALVLESGHVFGPTTPILDTFTRTENPIASGWSGPIEGPQFVMQTNGSVAYGTSVGGKNSAYWNSSFAANQEAYFDYNGASEADVQIYLRINNPGSATIGSWFQCEFSISNNQISVFGSYSSAQQDFLINGVAPSNGKTVDGATKAWAQVTGTTLPTINCYLYYSSWELVGTVTYGSPANAALQGSGYVGMRVFDSDAANRWIDNFGGGNV